MEEALLSTAQYQDKRQPHQLWHEMLLCPSGSILLCGWLSSSMGCPGAAGSPPWRCSTAAGHLLWVSLGWA